MNHHRRSARAAIKSENDRSILLIFDISPNIGIGKNACNRFSRVVVEDIVFTNGFVRDFFTVYFNTSLRQKAFWLEILK